MSRKSRADLSVVPLPLAGGRPTPPADLDDLERELWIAVVDAAPAHAFDGPAQQLLLRLVAQAVIAKRLEARLREFRRHGKDTSEEFAALASEHREAARMVAALLTSLRATPRSRTRARDAGTAATRMPTSKPWERTGA